MKHSHTWRDSTQLTSGFGVIVILVIVLSVYSIITAKQAVTEYAYAYEQHEFNIHSAETINENLITLSVLGGVLLGVGIAGVCILITMVLSGNARSAFGKTTHGSKHMRGGLAPGNKSLTDDVCPVASDVHSFIEIIKTMIAELTHIINELNTSDCTAAEGQKCGGAYKETLHSVNRLTNEFIDDVIQIINTLTATGGGNCDAELKKLACKKIALIIESMEEIKNSSHHINDILTAMDEIAFQTNLLAINASLQAAV